MTAADTMSYQRRLWGTAESPILSGHLGIDILLCLCGFQFGMFILRDGNRGQMNKMGGGSRLRLWIITVLDPIFRSIGWKLSREKQSEETSAERIQFVRDTLFSHSLRSITVAALKALLFPYLCYVVFTVIYFQENDATFCNKNMPLENCIPHTTSDLLAALFFLQVNKPLFTQINPPMYPFALFFVNMITLFGVVVIPLLLCRFLGLFLLSLRSCTYYLRCRNSSDQSLRSVDYTKNPTVFNFFLTSILPRKKLSKKSSDNAGFIDSNNVEDEGLISHSADRKILFPTSWRGDKAILRTFHHYNLFFHSKAPEHLNGMFQHGSWIWKFLLFLTTQVHVYITLSCLVTLGVSIYVRYMHSPNVAFDTTLPVTYSPNSTNPSTMDFYFSHLGFHMFASLIGFGFAARLCARGFLYSATTTVIKTSLGAPSDHGHEDDEQIGNGLEHFPLQSPVPSSEHSPDDSNLQGSVPYGDLAKQASIQDVYTTFSFRPVHTPYSLIERLGLFLLLGLLILAFAYDFTFWITKFDRQARYAILALYNPAVVTVFAYLFSTACVSPILVKIDYYFRMFWYRISSFVTQPSKESASAFSKLLRVVFYVPVRIVTALPPLDIFLYMANKALFILTALMPYTCWSILPRMPPLYRLVDPVHFPHSCTPNSSHCQFGSPILPIGNVTRVLLVSFLIGFPVSFLVVAIFETIAALMQMRKDLHRLQTDKSQGSQTPERSFRERLILTPVLWYKDITSRGHQRLLQWKIFRYSFVLPLNVLMRVYPPMIIFPCALLEIFYLSVFSTIDIRSWVVQITLSHTLSALSTSEGYDTSNVDVGDGESGTVFSKDAIATPHPLEESVSPSSVEIETEVPQEEEAILAVAITEAFSVATPLSHGLAFYSHDQRAPFSLQAASLVNIITDTKGYLSGSPMVHLHESDTHATYRNIFVTLSSALNIPAGTESIPLFLQQWADLKLSCSREIQKRMRQISSSGLSDSQLHSLSDVLNYIDSSMSEALGSESTYRARKNKASILPTFADASDISQVEHEVESEHLRGESILSSPIASLQLSATSKEESPAPPTAASKRARMPRGNMDAEESTSEALGPKDSPSLRNTTASLGLSQEELQSLQRSILASLVYLEKKEISLTVEFMFTFYTQIITFFLLKKVFSEITHFEEPRADAPIHNSTDASVFSINPLGAWAHLESSMPKFLVPYNMSHGTQLSPFRLKVKQTSYILGFFIRTLAHRVWMLLYFLVPCLFVQYWVSKCRRFFRSIIAARKNRTNFRFSRFSESEKSEKRRFFRKRGEQRKRELRKYRMRMKNWDSVRSALFTLWKPSKPGSGGNNATDRVFSNPMSSSSRAAMLPLDPFNAMNSADAQDVLRHRIRRLHRTEFTSMGDEVDDDTEDLINRDIYNNEVADIEEEALDIMNERKSQREMLHLYADTKFSSLPLSSVLESTLKHLETLHVQGHLQRLSYHLLYTTLGHFPGKDQLLPPEYVPSTLYSSLHSTRPTNSRHSSQPTIVPNHFPSRYFRSDANLSIASSSSNGRLLSGNVSDLLRNTAFDSIDILTDISGSTPGTFDPLSNVINRIFSSSSKSSSSAAFKATTESSVLTGALDEETFSGKLDIDKEKRQESEYMRSFRKLWKRKLGPAELAVYSSAHSVNTALTDDRSVPINENIDLRGNNIECGEASSISSSAVLSAAQTRSMESSILTDSATNSSATQSILLAIDPVADDRKRQILREWTIAKRSKYINGLTQALFHQRGTDDLYLGIMKHITDLLTSVAVSLDTDRESLQSWLLKETTLPGSSTSVKSDAMDANSDDESDSSEFFPTPCEFHAVLGTFISHHRHANGANTNPQSFVPEYMRWKLAQIATKMALSDMIAGEAINLEEKKNMEHFFDAMKEHLIEIFPIPTVQ